MKNFLLLLAISVIAVSAIDTEKLHDGLEGRVREIIAILSDLNSTSSTGLNKTDFAELTSKIYSFVDYLKYDLDHYVIQEVDHEFKDLTVPEIINRTGYPVEIHSITTEDGYILEAHRIPFGKKCPDDPVESKKVFWLQHGLLGDSSNFIITGEGRGLAYALADACFDVWMGNFRGNTYSRRHINFTEIGSDVIQPFFTFSWHEQGIYDLSASIDYALNETGAEKLYYAGHSMGNTAMWVLLSEKPDYNDKIELMNALAPVAYMSHMRCLIKHFAPWMGLIENILNTFKYYEVLSINQTANIVPNLCPVGESIAGICPTILFLAGGYSPNQLDLQALPVIFGHTPAGTSQGTFLHYGQGFLSGKFSKYDYGVDKNMERYNQSTPPSYALSKITAPVALYWSFNDLLADEQDVRRLKDELPNVVRFFRIDDRQFNHLDFIWALDQDKLINQPLIDFILNPPDTNPATTPDNPEDSTGSASLITGQIVIVASAMLAVLAVF